MFYVLPILATTVRACAAVANKNENSAHGLRRSVSCAKGVLMPLPHIHCVLRFSLCIFLLLIVGHPIPFGSVCLALQLILLKYDIWALLKIKCFLQQVVRDWLKSQHESASCLDHTWTFVACHPALSILLTSAIPGVQLAGSRGGHPPPALAWTLLCPARVREELPVLTQSSPWLGSCSFKVQKKAHIKEEWAFPIFFSKALNENFVRMTITFSPAE